MISSIHGLLQKAAFISTDDVKLIHQFKSFNLQKEPSSRHGGCRGIY